MTVTDLCVNKPHKSRSYLNYLVSVLVAAYFTHCSQSIPEAVITVVPAPDDGCQQPKHVELPTEM